MYTIFHDQKLGYAYKLLLCRINKQFDSFYILWMYAHRSFWIKYDAKGGVMNVALRTNMFELFWDIITIHLEAINS